MFCHIPDDDNVELVVQFGYFVDILADQCQVSVVGMYAVDFFCDCNLASVDVYAGHLATEIHKYSRNYATMIKQNVLKTKRAPVFCFQNIFLLFKACYHNITFN